MTLSLALAAADTSAWTPLWAALIGAATALTGVLMNNYFLFKNVRAQRIVDEQRRKEEAEERERVFWRDEVLRLGYDYVETIDLILDGLIEYDQEKALTNLSRLHRLTSKGMLIGSDRTYEAMADGVNRLSPLITAVFEDDHTIFPARLWDEFTSLHPPEITSIPGERRKFLNDQIKNTPPKLRSAVIQAVRVSVGLEEEVQEIKEEQTTDDGE